MTNKEYENPHFLEEWLKSRVEHQQGEQLSIEKTKQRINNINFSWHNLKGKFTIADFPNLTSLNLGNNSLEELEIKNCPKLEEIITSHNQLKDLKIKDCPKVIELYTSHNQLTSLDVNELTKLQVLSYSDNNFNEEKEKKLNNLGLAKQGKERTKPKKTLTDDILCDNKVITELDISNEVGWDKLVIRNCKNLTTLVADNCGLEELRIINCPNLEVLSFRHNKVKEINLKGLKKLKGLYCSNNKLEKLDLNNLKYSHKGKDKTSLKHLVCDNNPLTKLEIKNLKNLESLYCFKCSLTNLECNGLEKLEELYCANSTLQSLSLKVCNKLKILDCAENYLQKLEIINKKNLENVSCKENEIENLFFKNCENLKYLDFSRQRNNENALVDNSSMVILNSNKLQKIFYDKKTKVSFDWKNLPELELVGIGEDKGEGKNAYYSSKEIIISEYHKAEQILTNPNNYSLDDILKVHLQMIPKELAEKLVELAKKRLVQLNEKTKHWKDDEGYYSQEDEQEKPSNKEQNQDRPLSTPPTEEPSKLLTPQDIPLIIHQYQFPPKKEPEPDYKKLYYELLEKIKKGEITIENQEQITNSLLSEEQKQKLLKMLEKTNKNDKHQESESKNWTPWIISGSIVGGALVVGVVAYFLSRGKKNSQKKGAKK
jgi:Leucine-rich repeat (LRR) protein